ncbi:hypothetical protein LSCM1_00834 [Leishmania martiniquensis]|uniref:Uncharacterized protein n=1 Tax=Leishmania martiniquensis TaxID=1580590 RepID=A0A836GJK8_9TRYP|nr:hypothetical protein LSCM1_00834 [Leishmania martiniquensis]
MSKAHGTGCTPTSTSRKHAVDACATEGGDVKGPFHGATDPGTHSPDVVRPLTQVHLEPRGFDQEEGGLGSEIRGAVLNKDVSYVDPSNIDFSVSAVENNRVKRTPMALGRSISRDFSAPSPRSRQPSASLPLVAGDEETCEMAKAYWHSSWADPQQSSSAALNCTSSTAGAAADHSREAPSVLERSGNLKGALDAPVSTMRTTLCTASSGEGTRPSPTLGLSGCGSAAAVSISSSRSPADVTSFMPPTPSAGRNDSEVEGKEGNCETSAQSTDRRIEKEPQAQLSSNCSVPRECDHTGVSPQLLRVNSKNRSTSEDRTDHLGGGKSSSHTPVVSARLATTCLKPAADGYVDFCRSNSSLSASPGMSRAEESETGYRQANAMATEHNARASASCNAERVSSGNADRPAAPSEVQLPPDAQIPPYPPLQPGALAAEVLKSDTSTAHELHRASSPGIWAVQSPASTAPRQGPEPRTHSHPPSSGHSASSSLNENGKLVHGATAARCSPGAAATVTAVRTKWSTGSPSMSSCTHRGPNEEGTGGDVSGAATGPALVSVTSTTLPLQPEVGLNYDKAPGLPMEPFCIAPILPNSTSGRTTVTTVAGTVGGSVASTRSSNGSDGLCSPLPLSVEQQAYVDALPADAATCLPLIGFGAQDAVGARARLAPHPGTVTANGELSDSTAARVLSGGSLISSKATTAGNSSWSIPGAAEQHLQWLSAHPLLDSAPTAAPKDGVMSASRSRHRGTEEPNFGARDGNGSPNSRRGLVQSLSVDSSAVLTKQQAGGVEVNGVAAEEDALWGEPTSSTPTPAPESAAKETVHIQVRHVAFADPIITHFVEPPPSPWTGREYFFSPDYAHMEYKASEGGSPSELQQPVDVLPADVEEDEVLRSVPRFHFRLKSARAQAPSSLPAVAAELRGPAWEAWSRGSDGVRSRTSPVNSGEDAPTESRAPHAEQQAKAAERAPSQEGKEEGEVGFAVAERSQRVFFTKERLASRAALMRARRSGASPAGTTNVGTAAAASPSLPDSGASLAPLLRPPPAATASSGGDGGSPAPPIHPPPSSTPAANTISLALPDFAAPLRPAPALTQHSSNAAQALPSPSPDRDKHAATNANDDDDFGGWVQQQHATSARAPSGKTASPAASQPFTRERCTQLVASLSGGAVPVPLSAASLAVDTERVVHMLRDVFGNEDAGLGPPPGEPHSPDAPPKGISVNGPPPSDLLIPSDSLSTMGRVLEALSFTSLTSRASEASLTSDYPGLAQVSFDPRLGRHSFTTGTSLAAAVPSDGYVVPWITHSMAAGIASSKVAPTSADRGGLVQVMGSSAACASAEAVSPREADVTDGEDASVHLTRQRLFPSSALSDCPRCTVTEALSVASFLGSQRLPDAPTAAQWTERDVALAVLQEQCRMALEKDAVAEAERLEDVLRTAHS